MNLFHTSTRFTATRPTLTAIFAALSLSAASSAQASPSGWRSIEFGINARHCEQPRVIRHCEPVCESYADRERNRGFAVGKDAGFDAGYRDGIRGSCFDDCPTASLCRVSDFFERGYRAGFSRAYADGYARGKADRHHCVPRCR